MSCNATRSDAAILRPVSEKASEPTLSYAGGWAAVALSVRSKDQPPCSAATRTVTLNVCRAVDAYIE